MDRSTPYQEIFGETGIAAEHFPRILEQVGEGDAARDRDRFFATGAVGELLRAIVPDGGEGSAQIALLAYHAYHHWRAGEPLWRVDDAQLGAAVHAEPLGTWPLTAPSSAGYVQLPRNKLWVAGDAAQPAEAVDGWFWAVPERTETNALNLLLVLGLLEQRAGITVVELASGPLPPDGHWGDAPMRAAGEDFANILPGGEHLFGLQTAGEVLKLVSRIFHQLQGHGPLRDRTGTGGDRQPPGSHG